MRKFINVVLLIALALAIGTAVGFYSAWEKVREEFSLYIDKTTINNLTSPSINIINSIGELADEEDVEKVSIKLEPQEEGKARWLKAQFTFHLKPGALKNFISKINSILSSQNVSWEYVGEPKEDNATILLKLARKFTVAEILLTSPIAPAEGSLPSPCVAIIIDDLGYGGEPTERLLSLKGVPLTVAVLPNLPHSRDIAERAHEAGFEVMLHLPMEPLNGDVPFEKGTIRCDMDEEEIQGLVENALESVPWIVGVNNHMGSKATGDERVMRVVLSILREKGLFFIDSRTSPDSCGYHVAKELGLKCGERDVFLDGTDDEDYIKGEMMKLFKLAKERGKAIGIGHVREKTVDVLYELLPKVEEEFGVKLVFASQVID